MRSSGKLAAANGRASVSRGRSAKSSAAKWARALFAIENIAYDWTVTYDEVLYVLEGELRVTVGDEAFDCEPGDFLWLPKGTALNYAADSRAVALFAVAPEGAVDWAAFGLD